MSISRPEPDWSTLEISSYNSIFLSLWFSAFAEQIFQFFARPGDVDNYGLNTPLSLWKAQVD